MEGTIKLTFLPSRTPPSLRAAITAGVALVGALAVLSALLLVTLTTRLRIAAGDVADSMRSSQLVEEAEIELLLHARASDRTVRAAHESRLRNHLASAAEHVTSAAEGELLIEARRHLDHYFSRTHQTASETDALAEAFGSLEELTALNAEQWRAAVARAAAMDRLANRAGFATILFAVPLVSFLVWWTWRRALEPLDDLGGAMERFAAGDRSARAPAVGPQELRAMADRFNEMATELSRQREAQMAFLAGVAHDLRNPLSPLKMAAVLLSDTTRTSLDDNARGVLRVIGRQVDHLDRMIGDLLEVSRIEAGNLELRIQSTDVMRMVADVTELFGSGTSKHDVRVHGPRDPVRLACDPLRIQQVLNNLVSNAIKYSPAGGEVAITVERRQSEVSISVRDHGIGISKEDQRKLFEPFRRAARAGATEIPGVGLGLFVSRRIVEAHGGTLEIHSAWGHGATFTVRLPGGEPAATGQPADAEELARR